MKLRSKMLANPFIYQGYESPEYFCDREAETKYFPLVNRSFFSSTSAIREKTSPNVIRVKLQKVVLKSVENHKKSN